MRKLSIGTEKVPQITTSRDVPAVTTDNIAKIIKEQKDTRMYRYFSEFVIECQELENWPIPEMHSTRLIRIDTSVGFG
jgi:hypothetical protein